MSGKQLRTLDIGPNMLIVLVLLLSTLGALDITTLCHLLDLVRGISASVTISLRSCDIMTTQRAVFNYEEVIDLHTEVGRVSVIGIHTPTGDTPRRLCPGFFEQFKKYKYVGCSISLVPAATLPADPAQVSIGVGGDPEIDARDMLNPVMFHGCHGNDLGNILNRIYTVGQVGGSDLTEFLGSDSIDLMNMANGIGSSTDALDLLESLYYRALTDNTWKKAHIQRGFRKSGLRPRIYSLATNMQIQNAASLGGGYNAPGPFQGDGDALNLEFEDVTDPSVNPIRYFTPRTVPLGWLDTRQVVPYTPEGNIGDVSLTDLNSTIKGLVQGKTIWNELPKVFMGVIMLPPAYKTEFYFRMIINHVFAFAGFRGISMSNDMVDMPPTYYDWNDALSSGDSDDPDDPSPPGPAPPPESDATLMLRLLSGGLFRGAVFNPDPSLSSVTSNVIIKSTFWGTSGYGWESVNASEPYGLPIFNFIDGNDKACQIFWNGTGISRVVGDSTYTATADQALTYMSAYCDFSNMDSSTLLKLLQTGVTSIVG